MQEFTPEFFDAASAAWRENKIAIKGGSFAYKCTYKHSDGKMCNKIVSGQQYTTHPNWSEQCHKASMEFCKKHHIRGPQQNDPPVTR